MYSPSLINQARPSDWAGRPGVPYRPACVVVQADHPSRFRRKKAYTGKTARWCNRNYKRMPKDF